MHRRLATAASLAFVTLAAACNSDDSTSSGASATEAGVLDSAAVTPGVDAGAAAADGAAGDAGLTPSFDAGWGDASLPTPDLTTVCPTDAFEPNQTSDAGATKPLAVSSAGKVLIGASVTASDQDFYLLQPTKRDPIAATVAYVSATSPGPLTLEALDVTGTKLGTAVDAPSGVSHALGLTFEEATNGDVLLHVTSTAAACQPYELFVDTAVCTDAYEDNDSASSAVPLNFPSGVQNVTVTKADEDNYLLPNSATRGKCTITYAAAAVDPALTLNLFDSKGTTSLGVGTASGTATKSVVASWDATTDATKQPHIVKILAANDACTAYTLACTNVTP